MGMGVLRVLYGPVVAGTLIPLKDLLRFVPDFSEKASHCDLSSVNEDDSQKENSTWRRETTVANPNHERIDVCW